MHARSFRLGRFGRLGFGIATVAVAASSMLSGCGQPQLDDDVQVLVDPMGVPHIYAASDEDAFVASGYMMARMRLFQLEMVRRKAWGRQAELLGEKSLRDDIASRTMGFGEHGAASRKVMEQDYPTYARLTAAFVRGINLRIDEVKRGAAPLPAEFGPLGINRAPESFTDDDPYAIGKMLSFGMSSSIDYELMATVLNVLAPTIGRDFPLCTPNRPAFTMPDASQIVKLRTESKKDDAPGPVRPAKLPIQNLVDWQSQLAHYQPLVPSLGSNNWAVAGRYTDNGRPLLAGDPHQPLGNPSRFFAQHLNSAERGGSLDVVGFGFAGAPGVQLGHNRAIGWTATTNFADVMDLWRVSRVDSSQVRVGGKLTPVTWRHETIYVRPSGGPAASPDGGGADAAQVDIGVVAGLGVLLPDELLPVPHALLLKPDESILFNWTGFGATHEAAMYLGFDFAGGLADWDAAADRLEVGAVNLIAADQRSIRYHVHANVPRRDGVAKGLRPWQLMDGDDPQTLWSGAHLSNDQLPQALDPVRGYLATANNEPWGFTADGRVDNDPFYYGYFYDPGDRAARIESELLRLIREKPGQIGVADMEALQRDAHSTLADDLVPALIQAVSAIDIDPALAAYRNRPELLALAKRLEGWDRSMRRESPEAVTLFALSHFAAQRAEADDLGALLPTLFQASPAYALKPMRLALLGVAGTTGILQEGARPVLVGALSDAYAWLKTRFQIAKPEDATGYAWRDVHSARFDHVLGGDFNGGTFPVDGSVGTVNVSSASMLDWQGHVLDKWSSTDGSLYRMIVGFDASGQPQAQVNFTRGNDADPASPFFANQQENWLSGKHAPLLFHRSDIDAAAVLRLTLHRNGSVD